MSELKPTKGEWTTKDGQIYSMETGKTIALIPYYDEKNKEQRANALLISKAPEMFGLIDDLLKDKELLGIIKERIEARK